MLWAGDLGNNINMKCLYCKLTWTFGASIGFCRHSWSSFTGNAHGNSSCLGKNNTFCAVHAPLDLKAPTGDQIQCHATARGLYTVLLYLKVKVSTRPPNTWIEHPFDVLEQVQSMEATPGIRLDLTSRGRNKRPLGCPVVSCSDGNSGSL